jgi:hypothetical protein
MFKALLLLALIAGACGLGYWYGYNNGRVDGNSHSTERSLETNAGKYLDKLRTVEVKYKDTNGNIVIPKVEWDKMKTDNPIKPASD